MQQTKIILTNYRILILFNLKIKLNEKIYQNSKRLHSVKD
jgi:hypothetical protein